MNALNLAILLGVGSASFLFTGCGPTSVAPENSTPGAETTRTGTTSASSVAPPPETTVKPTQAAPSSKATPPVDFTIGTVGDPPFPAGEAFKVVLQINPETTSDETRVWFEADGTLILDPEGVQEIGPLAVGATYETHVSMQVEDTDPSEVRCWVEGRGPDGEVLFARSRPLFVISSDTETYTGTESLSATRIAFLEHQRETGQVTEEAYEASLHHIHSGGASVSITVSTE